MRIIVALALVVSSGLTAGAQTVYPLRELENSLRASRDFDQRVRREAVEQKRIERQQQEKQRKAAIREKAVPMTPPPVDVAPTTAPSAPTPAPLPTPVKRPTRP